MSADHVKEIRIQELTKLNQDLRDRLEKAMEAYERLASATQAQLLGMWRKVEHAVGKCMTDINEIAKDIHPEDD